jgi:hypothetical protein
MSKHLRDIVRGSRFLRGAVSQARELIQKENEAQAAV